MYHYNVIYESSDGLRNQWVKAKSMLAAVDAFKASMPGLYIKRVE